MTVVTTTMTAHGSSFWLLYFAAAAMAAWATYLEDAANAAVDP